MTTEAWEADAEFAAGIDRSDPLAKYRDQFLIPQDGEEDLTYLVGHSLGLQPAAAAGVVSEEMAKWAENGVKGHFSGDRPWVRFHENLVGSMARLVGADPTEVAVMNTLSVNLHFLMISFYQPTLRRHKILIEDHAFPSDHYAVESQIRQRGFEPTSSLIKVNPPPGEDLLDPEELIHAILVNGEELALVLLPGIQYYTGQVLPMAEIAAAAHSVGAKVGFDLAHAVGNIEMDLHDWNADFAAWCTYKYLNSGPGAVGGAFVHEKHLLDASLPRLHGWWGHRLDTRFQMDNHFDPEPNAGAWAVSNPPILAMAPMVASLAIFDEVGMSALRDKSWRMSQYLDFLLAEKLADKVRTITPVTRDERGCQLSIEVVAPDLDGQAIYQALQDNRVACDWRNPAVIRVAPTPLYNAFGDIHRFVDILASAVG